MRVKNKHHFRWYVGYIFTGVGKGSCVHVDWISGYLVSIFQDTTLFTHHKGCYLGFGDHYVYRWTKI
jgi:hypothetical protein